MISFASDYVAGAHPEVLKKLVDTNMQNLSGYGTDPYCARAAEKIRTACELPDAQVQFLVGGTQTNQIVIDTMLQPYEGVIAVETGHVSVHEAGAIEYSGHKILEIAGHCGKLMAADVANYITSFYADDNHEHMVFPGMVYISFPTECGTLYKKDELQKLYTVCKEFCIPLYIDGARLGYGLAAPDNDLSLPELASLCDVFYIGGTKVGALCGEAVVFTKNNMPKHFITQIKQHGALLAKGRLLGVQFDALFTDDLYMRISRYTMEMTAALVEMLTRKGCRFFSESPTNQQFIILENEKIKELRDRIGFGFWQVVDDHHTAVRFAVSWSTQKTDIEYLESLL